MESHPNNVTHFEQTEKVVQPEASQEQHCQSTVAEQENDEERVSSTNECPKDSESSQVHPDSNASDISPSPRKSLKEDLDYSSYDNGECGLSISFPSSNHTPSPCR